MKSLYLSPSTWDLCLDASGNIATCTEPYRLAQDAATACRTFLGECWYDTTIGVPYFEQILGKAPPLSLVKSLLVKAALTVPGVVSAKVFISGIAGRKVIGQIQVTDSTGAVSAAGF